MRRTQKQIAVNSLFIVVAVFQLVFVASGWAQESTPATHDVAYVEKQAKILEVLENEEMSDDSEISMIKALDKECKGIPDKGKKIHAYLSEGNPYSTTVPTDRKWRAVTIVRHIFATDTSMPPQLPINCLYALAKVAIKETMQATHDLNIRNRCYSPEMLGHLKRDSQPKGCPDEAWLSALEASRLMHDLTGSVPSQAEQVKELDAAAKKIMTQATAGCLGDCPSVQTGFGGTEENATAMKEAVCCDLLTKKKYVAEKSECDKHIKPDVPPISIFSKECVENFAIGLWKGIEALNPIEIMKAAPDIVAVLHELAVGNREQALRTIYYGFVKGFFGYEPEVWNCFNEAGKTRYRCQIVGQTAVTAAGGYGLLKVLRSLRSTKTVVDGISTIKTGAAAVTAKIENAKFVKAFLDSSLGKKFNPENIASLKKKATDAVEKQFNEMAVSHPETVGRLSKIRAEIKDTFQAARDVADIELNMKKATGAELENFKVLHTEAVKKFNASYTKFVFVVHSAVKTSLLALARRSVVSTQPISKHEAAPKTEDKPKEPEKPTPK